VLDEEKDKARPLVRVSVSKLMVGWQEGHPAHKNLFHKSPEVIFQKI